MVFINTAKTDFVTLQSHSSFWPDQGSFIYGFDETDDLLKKLDEFGVLTIIGGSSTIDIFISDTFANINTLVTGNLLDPGFYYEITDHVGFPLGISGSNYEHSANIVLKAMSTNTFETVGILKANYINTSIKENDFIQYDYDGTNTFTNIKRRIDKRGNDVSGQIQMFQWGNDNVTNNTVHSLGYIQLVSDPNENAGIVKDNKLIGSANLVAFDATVSSTIQGNIFKENGILNLEANEGFVAFNLLEFGGTIYSIGNTGAIVNNIVSGGIVADNNAGTITYNTVRTGTQVQVNDQGAPGILTNNIFQKNVTATMNNNLNSIVDNYFGEYSFVYADDNANVGNIYSNRLENAAALNANTNSGQIGANILENSAILIAHNNTNNVGGNILAQGSTLNIEGNLLNVTGNILYNGAILTATDNSGQLVSNILHYTSTMNIPTNSGIINGNTVLEQQSLLADNNSGTIIYNTSGSITAHDNTGSIEYNISDLGAILNISTNTGQIIKNSIKRDATLNANDNDGAINWNSIGTQSTFNASTNAVTGSINNNTCADSTSIYFNDNSGTITKNIAHENSTLDAQNNSVGSLFDRNVADAYSSILATDNTGNIYNNKTDYSATMNININSGDIHDNTVGPLCIFTANSNSSNEMYGNIVNNNSTFTANDNIGNIYENTIIKNSSLTIENANSFSYNELNFCTANILVACNFSQSHIEGNFTINTTSGGEYRLQIRGDSTFTDSAGSNCTGLVSIDSTWNLTGAGGISLTYANSIKSEIVINSGGGNVEFGRAKIEYGILTVTGFTGCDFDGSNAVIRGGSELILTTSLTGSSIDCQFVELTNESTVTMNDETGDCTIVAEGCSFNHSVIRFAGIADCVQRHYYRYTAGQNDCINSSTGFDAARVV